MTGITKAEGLPRQSLSIPLRRILGGFCEVNKAEAIEMYRSGEQQTVAALLRQSERLWEPKQKMAVPSKGSRRFCPECFEKQRKIDQMQEEIKRLKAQLRYRERRNKEGYFGSSTPSSKVPVKANSPEKNQKKRGGAQPGHPGYGRKALEAAEADKVKELSIADICPSCEELLEDKGTVDRTVIDLQPIKTEKVLYRLQHKYCPRCHRKYRARAPSVLPKHLYGNQLLAQAATMHYVHGIPMGRVAALLGINSHHLFGSFHKLARLLEPGAKKLIHLYRQAPVKHADETSWRIDGYSGYLWLFCTPRIIIFRFRNTRSASVAREVLGEKRLPGVLVVDRYNGYNKAPCDIQYCYAHLLRELKDLQKQFHREEEVRQFVKLFAPLLSRAIKLHSTSMTDKQYYIEARALKEKIIKVVESPARHLGIRRIQDIFYHNTHRMYHWVEDRRVPADNNLAERELRPTVVARKVSFGSQSQAGAKTREILMTVLNTLRKNTTDVTGHFKVVLDQMATNPELDPFSLLFPYLDSS
jgi:transposase/AraC-like DNA-binding protein